MKTVLAILLAVHGAIHLIGFARAFGLARVPQLHQAIARLAGLLWLGGAIGFLAGAVLLMIARRHWWAAAAPALAFSQVAILLAWKEAKLGTIVNLIVVVPLAISLLDLRGASLRSTFQQDVRAAVAVVQPAPRPITDADLTRLPPAVQRYLRRVGVVGKPRVRSFHATFRAEMRLRPDAAWMEASAEQYNFYDPPARLFFMEASRFGVPFDALHRYRGNAATMEVRVAGLVPVIDASGPEMTQGETVTLLNDMCVWAPGALVDAPIRWEQLDDQHARATFSNAGRTVSGTLSFDRAGDLVGFLSHDRYQSDGKQNRLLPWSTPVSGHRQFGDYRLPGEGEARWQEPSGEWTYGRFFLQRITYNDPAR
jgi:hypothetical protein